MEDVFAPVTRSLFFEIFRGYSASEEMPMPLKTLQPYVFPENLLESSFPPENQDLFWFVFHTRPRAEKVLAERLFTRSLCYFLPLGKHQWWKNGRRFVSYLPLFPGYLFFQGNEEQRGRALETDLIANVLPVLDQDKLHADLRNINRLICSEKPLTAEKCLPPGTPVLIHSGPLAGIEGSVIRYGKNMRIIVAVRLLRQGVSVEIDSQDVEPISDSNVSGAN